MSYRIPRGRKNPPIVLEKDGYYGQTTKVKRHVTIYALYDCLLYIPGPIDFLTGLAYQYEPYKEVTLESDAPNPKVVTKTYNQKDHCYILTKNDSAIFCRPGINCRISTDIAYRDIVTNKKMVLKPEEIKEYKDVYSCFINDKFQDYYARMANQPGFSLCKGTVYTTIKYKILPLHPENKNNQNSKAAFTVCLSKDSVEIVRGEELTSSATMVMQNGVMVPSSSSTITPLYHLYIGGSYKQTLDKDNCEATLLQYFGDSAVMKQLQNDYLIKYKHLETIGMIYSVYANNQFINPTNK